MLLAREFAPISTVFSNKAYLALAMTIGIAFWIIFNVIDQLLFFWPILDFYLPNEKILGFILSNLTAAMMGIVISMNVYTIKHSKNFNRSVFSGSSLGVASCACAGCSSLGLTLVSAFGGMGGVAFAFFIIYQIPLRIISLGLLGWTYYSVHRMLSRSYTTFKEG